MPRPPCSRFCPRRGGGSARCIPASAEGGMRASTARRGGVSKRAGGVPKSWKDVILQAPPTSMWGNPFFAAERNESMSSNLDYSALDLEVLTAKALPATEYKPIYGTWRRDNGKVATDTLGYDAAYGFWKVGSGRIGDPAREESVRAHYRVMWRRMAATTGERTLISAIYPPGTAHVHPVHSMGLPDRPASELVAAAASMSSLLSDFIIRSTVSGDIFMSAVGRLSQIPPDHPPLPRPRSSAPSA